MSPNRVHINDPNFYHKVYSTDTKFFKEPAMFKFAGELDALPFIMDPAARKVRRGIVNPMFSPRAIKDFSPLALQIIKGALKKIGDSYETGKPQCAQWANEVRERHQNGVYTDETGRQTVFDAILDAEPDRSTKGLVDEAFSLVIGGTETTVTTITYGVWCILKNPNVEKKMLEELRTVETNSNGLMECQNLMNLPYLTAVIHETLHISSPAPGILTRLVPSGGTRYGNHFLPADVRNFRLNSAAFNPLRPNLFPKPEAFMPERWLDNSDKASKKNLIPFSKGPRMCVGLNLSYMEAYVFLGNLIRRFDLSLHDNTPEPLKLRWMTLGD
ncbi:hypothetical protein BFJ71_g9951 [Fusarium oxysporum]|nr:hypothetical protein BFJ71_g9951 [Fusarium oxysporum]